MANDRPISMKTKEYRKVVKPLLERRRRARINSCLNELRNFILEATKQDSVQASKLEKADILEMTVHYLRLLLRQQCSTGSRASANDVGRFRAGFTECANEVSMFVSNMAAVNPHTRNRLLGHLSKCLGHLECVNTNSSPGAASPSDMAMQVSPPSGNDNIHSLPPSPATAGLSPCYTTSLPTEPLSPPQSLPSTPAFPVSPQHHHAHHPAHFHPSSRSPLEPEMASSSAGHWRDRDERLRRSSPHPYDDVDRYPVTSSSSYVQVHHQRYQSPSPLSPSSTCGSSYARSPPAFRMKSEPPALVSVDDQNSPVWRPW